MGMEVSTFPPGPANLKVAARAEIWLISQQVQPWNHFCQKAVNEVVRLSQVVHEWRNSTDAVE
jgi:hypothetical protein